MNSLFQERIMGQQSTGSEKSLPGATDLKVSDLLKTLQLMDSEPLAIILFGSFARGEEHSGSDIDLLFVFAQDKKIHRGLYLEWDNAYQKLNKKPSHEISPHFVHIPSVIYKSGSLWLECALNGIVLYEKNSGAIEKILMKLRQLIAEGQWRRQYAYGQPYWIGKT